MRRHTPHRPNFEFTVEPLGSIKTPEEARAVLQKIMDDCPDCRAARARGEEPIIFDGPLPTGEVADVEPRRRSPIFARRPRWRAMKRSIKR